MRSLCAVLLSFTLFASTTFAQTGQQNSRQSRPPVAQPLRSALTVPSAIYECDGDQCDNPRSGGALWLLSGTKGEGMWLYQAEAHLTVTKFDGHTIHIHRVDPTGSYSSNFTPGHGEFIGDYFGTITGNRIEGVAYWGGNFSKAAEVWHATIVGDDFCTPRVAKCPLRPDQLSTLGRNLSEARMFDAALRCFRIAAEHGDEDGKGLLGIMMMNGWGEKTSPSQIMALLKESADHDSYAGEKGLARAYTEGRITEKNPEVAGYWEDRANTRQSRLEAQQQSQADSQMAAKVLGTAALIGLMSALVGGGGDSGSSSSSSTPDYQGQSNAGYWYSHGGSNGGPPAGYHAGDPVH